MVAFGYSTVAAVVADIATVAAVVAVVATAVVAVAVATAVVAVVATAVVAVGLVVVEKVVLGFLLELALQALVKPFSRQPLVVILILRGLLAHLHRHLPQHVVLQPHLNRDP